MSATPLLTAIDKLLKTPLRHSPGPDAYGVNNDKAATAAARQTVTRVFQQTLTLASALYGASSHHVNVLIGLKDLPSSNYEVEYLVWPQIIGVLEAMKSDIEDDTIRNLELQGAGGAVADFLTLAKDSLSRNGDNAKNVAAVLVAAAYEDTIRTMGSALAGVVGRPDLQDVIAELKRAGVLTGPALTTALGYMKFRNDSLHADWDKVDRGVIGSCLVFTETLLTTHF